jgi:hypothetical protein
LTNDAATGRAYLLAGAVRDLRFLRDGESGTNG